MKELDRNSQYLVMTDDNTPLLPTFSDLNEMQAFIDLMPSDRKTTSTITFGDDVYDVMDIASQSAVGIRYIAITPKSFYLKQTSGFRHLVFFLMILVAGIGLSLSWFFSKKNYGRLENLFQVIGKKGKFNWRGNEFEVLQSALEQFFADKDHLEVKMEGLRDSLKTNFLTEAINRENIMQHQEKCAELAVELGFTNSRYAVVAFHAFDYSLFSPLDTNEDRSVYQFIVKNVFEELFNEKHFGHVCLINHILVCIINLSHGDAERFTNEISSVFHVSRALLQENFQFDLALGVSNIHDGIENLSAAFQEAAMACDYLILKQHRGIIYYNEIDIGTKKSLRSSLMPNCESALRESVRNADASKAENTIRMLFETYTKKDPVDINMVRGAVFDLAVLAMAISRDVGLPININYTQLSYISISEAETLLIHLFQKMCKKMDQVRKAASGNELVKGVEVCVQENLSNPLLNVSFVADALHYHAAHLSKVFLEQTNEKLLDYINRMRIEQAKELLTQSSMPLEDIAAAVGYSSSHILIRIFKKYEKITPGKYRADKMK